MKRSSLYDIILTVAAGGLEIVERTARWRHQDIAAMCKRLLRLKGEASAISLAHRILTTYRGLSPRSRIQFFDHLLEDFTPDTERLNKAIAAYQNDPNPSTVRAVAVAAES